MHEPHQNVKINLICLSYEGLLWTVLTMTVSLAHICYDNMEKITVSELLEKIKQTFFRQFSACASRRMELHMQFLTHDIFFIISLRLIKN